jgi:hypothetical protein
MSRAAVQLSRANVNRQAPMIVVGCVIASVVLVAGASALGSECLRLLLGINTSAGVYLYTLYVYAPAVAAIGAIVVLLAVQLGGTERTDLRIARRRQRWAIVGLVLSLAAGGFFLISMPTLGLVVSALLATVGRRASQGA